MKENESKRKQIKKVKTKMKKKKDINASNEKEEEKCERKKFPIVLNASRGKKARKQRRGKTPNRSISKRTD